MQSVASSFVDCGYIGDFKAIPELLDIYHFYWWRTRERSHPKEASEAEVYKYNDEYQNLNIARHWEHHHILIVLFSYKRSHVYLKECVSFVFPCLLYWLLPELPKITKKKLKRLISLLSFLSPLIDFFYFVSLWRSFGFSWSNTGAILVLRNMFSVPIVQDPQNK